MNTARGDRPRQVRRELVEGERLTGLVLSLPSPGVVDGNRLVLHVDAGAVSIPATSRRGWTVLERELAAKQVHVGDTITVEFVGWRETGDDRRYRLVHVHVHGGFDEAA